MSATSTITFLSMWGVVLLGTILFVGIIQQGWKLNTLGQRGVVIAFGVFVLVFVANLMRPGPAFGF